MQPVTISELDDASVASKEEPPMKKSLTLGVPLPRYPGKAKKEKQTHESFTNLDPIMLSPRPDKKSTKRSKTIANLDRYVPSPGRSQQEIRTISPDQNEIRLISPKKIKRSIQQDMGLGESLKSLRKKIRSMIWKVKSGKLFTFDFFTFEEVHLGG